MIRAGAASPAIVTYTGVFMTGSGRWIITVEGPDGSAHVIDLAQEAEGWWSGLVSELTNAGHSVETIVRTLGERLKSAVQPVLSTEGGAATIMEGINAEVLKVRQAFASDLQAASNAVLDVLHNLHDKHAPGAQPANDEKPAAVNDQPSAA